MLLARRCPTLQYQMFRVCSTCAPRAGQDTANGARHTCARQRCPVRMLPLSYRRRRCCEGPSEYPPYNTSGGHTKHIKNCLSARLNHHGIVGSRRRLIVRFFHKKTKATTARGDTTTAEVGSRLGPQRSSIKRRAVACRSPPIPRRNVARTAFEPQKLHIPGTRYAMIVILILQASCMTAKIEGNKVSSRCPPRPLLYRPQRRKEEWGAGGEETRPTKNEIDRKSNQLYGLVNTLRVIGEHDSDTPSSLPGRPSSRS